jgi:hypothetical protein
MFQIGRVNFHGSVNNRFIIVFGSRQHNSTIDVSRSEDCHLATPFEAITWGAANSTLSVCLQLSPSRIEQDAKSSGAIF